MNTTTRVYNIKYFLRNEMMLQNRCGQQVKDEIHKLYLQSRNKKSGKIGYLEESF
jgi:hypothetical protein